MQMNPTPPAQPDLPQSPLPIKALLLGLDLGLFDAERSMAELANLAQANGMEAVGEVLQKRSAPDAATALGIGRLAEAKTLAGTLGAEISVYDGELSGSQMRNLENILKIPVIDRTMLILEIFKSRAVTGEGKLQTELATLEYRLPRLSGMGTALSRQAGGGAGGGGARRGGGETQLEYDRRAIYSRIALLKRRLAAMQASRSENRRARQKNGVPLIAVVGYTNVGKSSLVNALTGSDISAADMLFATLDPTARRMALPGGQTAVIIDTVGFVSRLPHDLVAAFKSTLEEAKYADLILEVCDASAPGEAEDQLAVTDEVLRSLDILAERKLVVYNKCDLADSRVLWGPGVLAVSARTGQGLDELKNQMAAALAGRMTDIEVVLPYSQMHLSELLRKKGRVYREEYRPEGVYYSAGVEMMLVHKFRPYLCGPS